MSNDLLDAALRYRKRGWSVVPAHTISDRSTGQCSCRRTDCESPGKHPRVRWREFQDRIASVVEVTTWWTRRGWENSNVAIITGVISALVVIDVDPRHGGDESANRIAKALAVCAHLVLTGGGGTHYYYARPEGDPIPNAVNLLPGIDVRGDGGYVIGEPSNHVSGGSYTWEASTDEEAPLAELPAALLKTIRGYERPFGEAKERGGPLDLEGLLTGDIKIREGQRNDGLARIAGHYAGGGKTEAEMLKLVQGANNLACEPPLDEKEVATIVHSIFVRERRRETVGEAVDAVIDGDRDNHVGDLTSEEALEMAAQLFGQLNVPAVTDWFVLRGDSTEYVLVTPEDELRLGADIFDYAAIRRRLGNELAVLAPTRKQIGNWDRRAIALRKLAREEAVEATRAVERVGEWTDNYIDQYQPGEVPLEQRKDRLALGPILISARVHLRVNHLCGFVESWFGEQVKPPMMRRLLKRAHWEATHVSTSDGAERSTLRVWRSPQ